MSGDIPLLIVILERAKICTKCSSCSTKSSPPSPAIYSLSPAASSRPPPTNRRPFAHRPRRSALFELITRPNLPLKFLPWQASHRSSAGGAARSRRHWQLPLRSPCHGSSHLAGRKKLNINSIRMAGRRGERDISLI